MQCKMMYDSIFIENTSFYLLDNVLSFIPLPLLLLLLLPLTLLLA
jgi:hypothetical protein